MTTIDHSRFVRVLTRSKEVATEQGLPPILAHVYDAAAAAPIETYLTASNDHKKATMALSKEGREGTVALEELDAPYRVARSAVLAIVKVEGLPDTLKTQRTDTDKLNAIQRLLDVVNEHAGEPWADALLTGDFGTKATAALKEVNEAIVASKALNKAMLDRAAAYGPAYEAYLGFKQIVRDALGTRSKQYKRIHLRNPAGADEAEAPKNDAPATPPPPAVEPPPAMEPPPAVESAPAVA